MQVDAWWTARRLAVLRDVLARWTAELPAIKALDAKRARAHEEAIIDLRRAISGIEMEHGSYVITAMTQSAQRPTHLS